MISFYPGPSQVYAKIPAFVKDAHRTGVLSMNHRSPECMNLVKRATAELKKKLHIHKSYTVLFLSSATECWEVIAQSLVQQTSLHIYNGAFGKKWFTYTQALKPDAISIPFDREKTLPVDNYKAEVLCITQNETSNGTQVNMETLRQLRKKNPDSLLAIDATSSMGGQALDFSLGDVWFASAQKCFGLPAGFAVMICSPRAVLRAQQIHECAHYNSLVHQLQFAEKFQTTHTPNVLAIYLLYRVFQELPSVRIVHKRLHQQAVAWYNLLETKTFNPLVANASVRSDTVVAVTGSPAQINRIKTKARKAGFLLGDGYGELKSSTFRIANFPAIKPADILSLMRFFEKI
ncbi:MAG TPA: aminotransferase class V-fold PLP-dependent enzyme [Cyclobacteriaceae bacterium]|nr:aminotransferase class V-fold PLP-dependent enzyme [Cyclobacteriaceae bacterium]